METIMEQIVPMYITFFLPIVSASLPENGRDNPADIVNKVITNPFCPSPPRFVMNWFNSGIIKLNPVIKKNMEIHNNQKFFP